MCSLGTVWVDWSSKRFVVLQRNVQRTNGLLFTLFCLHFQAVILSKENPIFRRIGERIHSLFFLATPHRGSDLAKILNNIMKVSFQSTKAYVTNLERGSEATQLINDQFRHYYSGIHLHSFLESIPINLGYGTALVVDRSSATLGTRSICGSHL